jgi:uridine kinase
MLARRIRRDVQDRGRSVEGVLEQYGIFYTIGASRLNCTGTCVL